MLQVLLLHRRVMLRTLRLRHLRWRLAVPGVVLRVARSSSCGLAHSRTRPHPQPLRKAGGAAAPRARRLLGPSRCFRWCRPACARAEAP
eukprot:1812688-Prymnesium_polylepis.1